MTSDSPGARRGDGVRLSARWRRRRAQPRRVTARRKRQSSTRASGVEEMCCSTAAKRSNNPFATSVAAISRSSSGLVMCPTIQTCAPVACTGQFSPSSAASCRPRHCGSPPRACCPRVRLPSSRARTPTRRRGCASLRPAGSFSRVTSAIALRPRSSTGERNPTRRSQHADRSICVSRAVLGCALKIRTQPSYPIESMRRIGLYGRSRLPGQFWLWRARPSVDAATRPEQPT
jgi:hypothetical protein